MMQALPQTNYLECNNGKESYRIFYTAWGRQDCCDKTLLCAHSLNRNSRDWDFVASYFVKHGYYVVAPDIVGRGNSDHLIDYNRYDIKYYTLDMLDLIQKLELKNVDFIGTSMGGIIGMSLAVLPHSTIKKLILNDIGAEVEYSGLSRIAAYTKDNMVFNTFNEAKDYVQQIARPFGDLNSELFEYLTISCVQKNSYGKYEFKRDANINKIFDITTTPTDNFKMWEMWQQIKLPTLVIHGSQSDVLSSSTITKMQEINPLTQRVEVENAGHAPYLYNDDHMKLLHKFLID